MNGSGIKNRTKRNLNGVRNKKKNTRKHNKTIIKKKLGENKPKTDAIRMMVRMFMEMLVVVKLYHWKTMDLSIHLASDDLYKSLNNHIDRFVELLIGKTGHSINNVCISCFSLDTKHHFIEAINGYIQYLRGLNRVLDSHKDSELITIRDEMIGDFIQLIYLIRLK